jgi:glycosyltransferase involved in cell wall biosynthesis
MRVLHVVTRMNVGGVATLVRNLANELPAHGLETVLATGAVQDGEIEVADLPPGVVRVPGLGRAPRAADEVRALRALRALIRDVEPDIVHTHTAKAGVLGRLAAEGTGLPRVHTFHGHLLHGYFGPAVTTAVCSVERALAARTDLLISSGARVGADLRAAGVGRRSAWRNIPPGVVPPPFVGAREPGTVAFVSRLVPVKRPDRVLDVARLLPYARFIVAGDGPLRDELEAAAPPNVEFVGWVSKVGTIYGRAELVLLCSENEAMPLALVEGALCGLPAVTTDAGSACEVVDDGRSGLIVQPDPAALAEAISELLTDDNRRRAMGRAALHDARRRHTVEAMARAHVTAYEQVASMSSRRR